MAINSSTDRLTFCETLFLIVFALEFASTVKKRVKEKWKRVRNKSSDNDRIKKGETWRRNVNYPEFLQH